MQLDMPGWLSLVTRAAVTSAVATVETADPSGVVRVVSEHHLRAESLLRWSYAVKDDHGESHSSCDGRELVQVSGTRKPVRSRVPDESAVDDPWYFYSWPAAVDAWFVEMLRPVDLLARVVVSTVEQDAAGAVHIGAGPMGNEPAPYNGFSLPDGRALRITLDTARGCLSEVLVSTAGRPARTYRLTHLR
ncbi:hypothetical protein GA0070616_3125 [Micromonospora nigra]|uniref:Uncharacterized protein n=1 Tax=Micromonospora nigra TaxID=145857 RepID=A0A1C6S7S3_9ACTN|nr:hypothetical protein [Micromonospora nigra]SCL25544.1 hypothetical protein GA0070616_3125 [Micromonospora nigra]